MARSMECEGKPLRRPCCVVAGGETTVTVTGNGKGGRAQEFAAAAALEIADLAKVWVVAIGTDGTDGPTDAAGACIDESIIIKAHRPELEPAAFLAAHDSYHFFEKVDGLIKTGPTGTNVMDVRILLLPA